MRILVRKFGCDKPQIVRFKVSPVIGQSIELDDSPNLFEVTTFRARGWIEVPAGTLHCVEADPIVAVIDVAPKAR
jgi:hypothetical protein